MGSCWSEMWSQLKPQTSLFSGFLCAYQVLVFIYWVKDKYMTVTALLHCIAASLIILGTLTLFCLYLPHMVTHLSATTKPRKTGGIMILIGGILHFIGAVLAISNPIYCSYFLCEIHIFVFMVLPFSITMILFLDEFYVLFYRSRRFRIVIYSFILFISGILFVPYYATTRKMDEMQLNGMMSIIFEIIWCIILITSCILMFCVGLRPKIKVWNHHRNSGSTASTFNSIALSSPSDNNGYIIDNGDNTVNNRNNCCSMHDNKRKTLILINALLLMLFGSSTMVSIYFYDKNGEYNLFICYYCLVVVISWFIGIDSIYYYRDIEYESIANDNKKQQKITKRSHNKNNPFNDDNINTENERIIIEQNDLDNYNKNNAWRDDDNDQCHNDNALF